MSLFLRIFLWFWLAMALVIAALAAAVITTQERSVLARWHEAIGGAHLLHAQTAVEVYERGNADALRAYLERAERSTHIRAYVFDPDGSEVLGRRVSEEIKTLAAAGISGFAKILKLVEENAPLRRNVTIEEVGNAAAFLMSDLAAGITGEITYVDAGFNTTVGAAL